MAQRKVTYRAELDGGNEVKSEFGGIARAGREAYDTIGKGAKSADAHVKAFERALDKEERSFRALKASVDPAYAAQMRFQRSQDQVNRAVRLGVVSQKEAATVLRQLEARTRGVATAMEMVDGAAGRSSHGLRNALLQVNQIGQQAAAGGNILTATAIQLPDILGGFGGILPLIAGAAVGLGAAFIPKLFEADEAAEDLKGSLDAAFSTAQTALDAAREAQDRYTAAIRLSGAAQSIVTPQILQSLSLEVKAREALANLERMGFEDRKRTAEAGLAADRARLDQLVQDATNSSSLAAQAAMRVNNPEILEAATTRRRQQTQAVMADNEELVRSIQRQQAELDLVNALLAQNGDEASQLVDELIKAAEEGGKIKGAIGGIDFSDALAGAVALSKELGISLHKALQIRGAVGASAQARRDREAGVIFDPRDPNYDPIKAEFARVRENYGTVSPFDPSRIPKVKSTEVKSGAASREANQLDQEALRIRRATTTELEKYNVEMALANKLLEEGKISQETYNRHVAATKQAYEQATQGNNQFQRYVTMGKDAVINAIMGQKGAFDQLKQAIIRATIEYAVFRTVAGQQVSGGIGGLFKSVFSGMLPSFDGGGYTGDGPRSGGLDGRGGMLAVVHPQERITDNHGSGRGQGGGRGDGLVPFVGIGDGLAVSWLRQADARTAAQLGGFANMQRMNFGPTLGTYQSRGTL